MYPSRVYPRIHNYLYPRITERRAERRAKTPFGIRQPVGDGGYPPSYASATYNLNVRLKLYPIDRSESSQLALTVPRNYITTKVICKCKPTGNTRTGVSLLPDQTSVQVSALCTSNAYIIDFGLAI